LKLGGLKKQLFRDKLISLHQDRQITDAADRPITTNWGFQDY